PLLMRYAKSNKLKAIEASRIKDQLYEAASVLWATEQIHPTGTKGKPLSLEKICTQVSADHLSKTKVFVKLTSSTLHRHITGGTTLSEFNSAKGWLSKAEERVIVLYACAMAKRGFPLNARLIQEHANEIIQA
ncbi:hypothetical protein DL96DRAFT_1440472, partial [Flagelloscypha sp. PMI_526]